MDCDRVFVILTRGPFPSGSAEDDAVEAHLVWCFDCQRLAEALRPDHDLVRESVGLDESRDLPGYHGRSVVTLGNMRVSLTETAARVRPKHRAYKTTQSRRQVNWWELTAAVVLGVILAAALRTLAAPTPQPLRATDVLAIAAAELSRQREADWNGLLLSDLPDACRQKTLASIASDSLDGSTPLSGALRSDDLNSSQDYRAQYHWVTSSIQISAASEHRLRHSCKACHTLTAGRF